MTTVEGAAHILPTKPKRRAGVPAVRFVRAFLTSQEGILLLSIIVLLLAVGTANPRYLSERNLSDILQGNAYIAVAAIGMTMVIVTGNIDISVGSMIGVLATLCGLLATSSVPSPVAWLITVAAGGLIGAFTGALVAFLRIPSIVVTLGMMSILRGGLVVARGGETIYGLPDDFGLAQFDVVGIPNPVWIMVVLTVLAALWMRFSPTGRALYAVGGNADAARNSGINVPRMVFTAFILNGCMVGVASVLYATQFTTIQAIVPPNQELLIITSAVVGGVSILGGTGTVIGAMFATILLRAIGSALVFINVPPEWIKAIQGTLILVTVLVDIFRRRQTRPR